MIITHGRGDAASALRPLLMTALLLIATTGLPAQQPAAAGDGTGNMTRAQLEAALQEYEASATNSEYSRQLRQQAQLEAAMIRDRLENGDFKVGDQISLNVVGDPDLTGTFTVAAGNVLILPGIGEISVAGVLRSELQDHLRTELGRYIRDPVVRAEALIRLAVMGSVGNPGFYNVSSTALLSDVVMQAGGPSGNAELDRLVIERRGEEIWDGEPLQEALASGRTLDQLNLQAGDQVLLPSGSGSFWSRALPILGVVSSVTWLIIRVAR